MTEFEKLRHDAEKYKHLYPTGTRIVLEKMHDKYPVPTGTMGTVRNIDVASNIDIAWDNGRTLSLCPQVDEFHYLTTDEQRFDDEIIAFANNAAMAVRTFKDSVTYDMPDGQHKLHVHLGNFVGTTIPAYIIDAIPTKWYRPALYKNADDLLREIRYLISNYLPISARQFA